MIPLKGVTDGREDADMMLLSLPQLGPACPSLLIREYLQTYNVHSGRSSE